MEITGKKREGNKKQKREGNKREEKDNRRKKRGELEGREG